MGGMLRTASLFFRPTAALMFVLPKVGQTTICMPMIRTTLLVLITSVFNFTVVSAQDSPSDVADAAQITLPTPPIDNLADSFPKESPAPSGTSQEDLTQSLEIKLEYIEALRSYRSNTVAAFHKAIQNFTLELDAMSKQMELKRATGGLNEASYRILEKEFKRLFAMTSTKAPLLASYLKWEESSRTKLNLALSQRDRIRNLMRDF